MSTQTELQEIREETMRFMRDHYDLDEVSDGEKERAGFEAARDRFSPRIQEIYDASRTYHDGKWVFFPVAEMSMLEEVKQVIVVKKKPNRKGISKA
jgi:hypothetical protein